MDAARVIVPVAVPIDAAAPVAAPVPVDAAIVETAPDAAVRTAHPPLHKRPPVDAAAAPVQHVVVDAGMPSIDLLK